MQPRLRVISKKNYTVRKSLAVLLVGLVLLASPLPAFADVTTQPATTQPVAISTANDTTAAQTSNSAPTVTAPVLNLSTAVSTTSSLNNAANTTSSAATPPSDPAATPKASQDSSSVVAENTSNTITGKNTISSTATSGNASVTDNKKAGDARTGTTQADATVVNVANSTTNFGTGNNFTYFTKDITGDQTNDVTIDPSTLMQGAVGTTNNNGSFNLQTAVSLTDILNNISLSAKSGDATVSGNKKAGDATSGDASALANVINIVGSAISAQNSFLGVVNIYGNLKGNILVPQSFVDSLIDGSNTSASSLGTGGNMTTIANTINASAASGNALVTDNRRAGDATSGTATTSLTVYNLTGQEVVAKNSLLVFVNVLGKWVGMIVQAPGTNSAQFGKDIQTSGIDTSANGDAGQNTSGSTTHITNNISVDAASGSATVSNNKKAGSATSGNAASGVNLVNITNSNFKLGDWFGALFINVLGSWVGDFGIKADNPTGATSTNTPGQGQAVQDVKIFRFDSEAPVTPTENDDSSNQYQSLNNTNNTRNVALTVSSNDGPNNSAGSVLGASTTPDTNVRDSGSVSHNINIDMVALVAMVGALTLLIALGSLAVRRRFITT